MTRTRFALGAFAVATSIIAWHTVAGPVLFLAVVVIALVVGCCGWLRWRHRGAQSTVHRWNRCSAKHRGMAGRGELLWHCSAWAMRRKATVLRPSFAKLTGWERWRVPVTEYAVPLTRVGWFRVWAPIEEVIAQYGRPRRGKTGQLVHWLLDAPGAVLATSTKVDLYHLTQGLRAKRGPVYVFNPTNIGELPTTIAFDPLFECQDAERAEERAIDLISGGSAQSVGDGKRWDEQAQRVLTGLLHAAALGGYSMTDVLTWVANPGDARRTVMALLRTSPSASAFVPSAEQFFDTNSRTQSSVTFTIMPALAWLSNQHAVAATQGATRFDIERVLADQATVYLLASAESRMGPLLAALTGYIAREAKRIAARCPGGRLDPPLRLVLDEAANICPVPLDAWSSDFGSHGITICATFQSRQQVIGRWGVWGAGAIANNTGATVLHAYGSETADLQHFVTLADHRDEAGPVGSPSRRVPVLSLTQLTNLPRGTVVVWPPETAVTVGRMRPAWRRRDLRAQLKSEGLAAATLVAETEEHLADAAVTAAERVTTHTAGTPDVPGRWAVDPGGLPERVDDSAGETPTLVARGAGDDHTRAARNGRAGDDGH
jgi:type IV secretion system protein VirD4